MRDFLLSLDSKKMKKLLRNRDFVFCAVAYPLAILVFIILKVYINTIDIENVANYYTFVSFVILASVTVISIYERVEKKMMHKVQGDKLKIKQNESNWKQ